MDRSALTFLVLLGSAFAAPSSHSHGSRAATSPVNKVHPFLNGILVICAYFLPFHQGLVAFGVIPSNATDSFGETLGGLGSAIAIKRGTFKKSGTSFSGTLRTQADRGYNVCVMFSGYFSGRI